MSGMGGSPFGSAHQDVLGQTPTDPESKQRLVDEIKDRARKAFARRDMPVCEALYSKALKVLPDAPLYSNRSAVRLALGRFDDAFEDATKATQTDSSYAKGYYRLGQAGEKCGKFSEAQKAYEKGKELEPDSKVWPSSLLKLEKAKQAYEAKPKKKAETAPDLLAPRTAQPIPEKGKENARKSGAAPASESRRASTAWRRPHAIAATAIDATATQATRPCAATRSTPRAARRPSSTTS